MGASMRTMVDVGAGWPAVSIVLNRNRYMLYHCVFILTLAVTTNSVRNAKTMQAKYFKKDRDGKFP